MSASTLAIQVQGALLYEVHDRIESRDVTTLGGKGLSIGLFIITHFLMASFDVT